VVHWHLEGEIRTWQGDEALKETTAREMIQEMPKVFRPEKAKGVNAVIQFRLSGEGGGEWYVTVKDQKCVVTEGVSNAAQGTIMMTGKDYVALANGKLGGMKAFLTGRVKTSGDFTLLQKMQAWFPR
jgi:putative sterol carrier protein